MYLIYFCNSIGETALDVLEGRGSFGRALSIVHQSARQGWRVERELQQRGKNSNIDFALGPHWDPDFFHSANTWLPLLH